ncbi:MAG TPA: serine/threonine-protein kinase [Vicinamibacterales bacterium]|nr:serine/threonine-protein kinase [Vicinamibacterales bacterium]
MSEAVLDRAIENIADGLTVDWAVLSGAAQAPDGRLAKCLRIINDVASLHRADAANLVTEMPTGPATVVDTRVHIPEAWGKYKLADRVGAGSYGAVYRAWDADLERDVAIKILHHRFGDMRLKDTLLKEGRALARIRHDNVVRVIGVEAHEDRVALCMEFVKGQTLDEIVRRQGTLSAREAIGIGEDLCRALAAVHRAGYIHRDVKAKNVMRDEGGKIVLMDFGTGRAADRPGAFGDRAGTPLYMAPEVLENEPASPTSDVYSLGVLLYHLVTGAYPVDARTIDQLREAHAKRQHRWLSERRPDLPVTFMQVVERAIALDPQDRYANPSELLSALSALRIGPHPTLLRVSKWTVVLAVLVVGMIALGAITSEIFNVALDRSGFASEGVWDYLVWGRRTSFPPFLILVMALLTVSALAVLRRLAVAISKRASALDAFAANRFATLGHRLRMDEAPVLASYSLLISAAALAAAWWYFTPLILALVSRISTASADDLALLSPRYVTYHNYYRGVFSAVVMIAVAVWYPVWKLVRKGQSVHWGMVAGGILVTCVSMALLHFPHRLLYFNKSFDAVSWNNERCYIIGERNNDRLLFCPSSPPPRNRVVQAGDKALVPLNVRESIFTQFAEHGPSPEVPGKS